MGELRLIRPMRFAEINPAQERGEKPRTDWANPTTLFVDESYQRGLSNKSVKLIKNIVENWNWNRMKPPVVVEHDNGYEVIDGQHTAIAAATHPDIDRIPIMIVQANEIQGRASAFVSHNNNRIPVSAMQIFYSRVVAEDETALEIDKIMKEEGIILLKKNTLDYEHNETVAITTLEKIYNNFGPAFLRRVLKILSYGQLAPIGILHIRAIRELIRHEDLLRTKATDDDVATAVRRVGPDIEKIARRSSDQTGEPLWKSAMQHYGIEAKKIVEDRS